MQSVNHTYRTQNLTDYTPEPSSSQPKVN